MVFLYNIGIAFPCCISVNNCICHYSPLSHDPDTVLKEGDLAKIDMGAHIDGFIAVVAHTGKLYQCTMMCFFTNQMKISDIICHMYFHILIRE